MSTNKRDNQCASKLFARVKESGNRKSARENWSYVLRHSEQMISTYLKTAEAGLLPCECGSNAIEWLEAFGENLSYDAYECDEEGFEMQCLCRDCAKILRLAVKHRDASMKFRVDIADRVKNLGRYPVFKEGFLDIDELHQNLSLSVVSPEEKLKSLDELIAADRKKGWNIHNTNLADNAIERYLLLRELGKDAEAEKAINEDIAEVKICEFMANAYLEEDNFIKALGVLDMGIDKLWKCFDRYHKLRLWKKKLEIYEKLGDSDGMISCYRSLFSLAFAPLDLDYFRMLKSMIPEREWNMSYYDLMAEKRFSPSFMMSTGADDTKAAILIEECRLEELGDYLANVGPMYILPGCEQYGSKVPEKKLGLLLQNCAAELRRMAKPTTGSSRYESIAHYMQVVQRLPGGKKIVAELKDEFVRNYSNRPAMMRALRAVKV